MADKLESVLESVTRIQNLDTSKLTRRDVLGALSFEEAIPHIDKVINLYRQIPTVNLGELTEPHLDKIQNDADSFYSLIGEIQNFDPSSGGDINAARQQIIQKIENSYQSSFNALFNLIGYLSSRERDFSALEQQARAATQAATDEASRLSTMLADAKAEADGIISDIRKTASEQGVTQQAIYFKDEADLHSAEVTKWQKYTVRTAIALGVYAFATVFIKNISFLNPSNSYEAVQLSISKVLVFSVIAYMLFLSSRTLFAHRHNAIINRHRQNALLTFNALANAANNDAQRDIVLTHAASCIFAPQDTGYAKSTQSGAAGTQLIEILPKLASQSGSH